MQTETYTPSRQNNIQRLIREAITMRTDPLLAELNRRPYQDDPVEPKPDPDLPPPEGDETPSDDE